MTQSTLRLTEKTYKTWPKKLRLPTPDTVEIVQTNNTIITVRSVPELRKDIEYETDENIPSCCLAMCLDWFLQKIVCRASQEVGNTDHEVYGRNDQERF